MRVSRLLQRVVASVFRNREELFQRTPTCGQHASDSDDVRVAGAALPTSPIPLRQRFLVQNPSRFLCRPPIRHWPVLQ